MIHSPKIAALTAWREGLLSFKGRSRLEAHLAKCEVCREAQAAMEVFDRISGDIRATKTPELDWERVTEHLDQAITANHVIVPTNSKNPPRRRGWLLAFAAATAAAAAILLRISVDTGSTSTELARAPSARPSRARIVRDPQIMDETPHWVARVMLSAGDVKIREDGIEHDADIDDELREATAIRTESDSELHLRLAERTGVALFEQSSARFAALRSENVILALEQGRVSSVVDGEVFRGSSRFLVMASEHRFEGRATHFEVELRADELTLLVSRGEVTVHRPDGRVEVVVAPGHWSTAISGQEGAARAFRAPYGLGDDPQAVLRAEHPDIVRWEIGDFAFEGRGGLAMRVGLGVLSITGFDAEGRAFRRTADIGGDGLHLDTLGLAPDAPRVRANGFLPEREIREVVERGQLRLRQCYEQGLRERPDLEGRMRVQITVGLDGSVMRYQVTDGDVPEGMQACVRNYVERWSFPPPRGGTVTFEAPLTFGRAGL